MMKTTDRRLLVVGLVLALGCSGAGKQPTRPAAVMVDSDEAGESPSEVAAGVEQSAPGEVAANPTLSAEVDRLMRDVTLGGQRRKRARKELIDLGTAATQDIIRHFQSPAFTVRWEAVNVLGYTRDPEAAGPLVGRVLHDENPHVRWRALWAVTNCQDGRVADRFREALGAEDETTQWNAAVGGSMFGVREVLPYLQARVRSRRGEFETWEAVNALGRIRDESSIPLMEEILAGCDSRLRREAAIVLGKLRSLPRAVEILIGLFDDPDAGVRWRAAMGLRKAEEPAAREAARRRLESEPDAEVRKHLKRVLGQR